MCLRCYFSSCGLSWQMLVVSLCTRDSEYRKLQSWCGIKGRALKWWRATTEDAGDGAEQENAQVSSKSLWTAVMDYEFRVAVSINRAWVTNDQQPIRFYYSHMWLSGAAAFFLFFFLSASNEKLINSAVAARTRVRSETRGRRPSRRLINNHIQRRSGSLKWVKCGNEVTAAGMCPAPGGYTSSNRHRYYYPRTHTRVHADTMRKKRFICRLDSERESFLFVAYLGLVWWKLVLQRRWWRQMNSEQTLSLHVFAACHPVRSEILAAKS